MPLYNQRILDQDIDAVLPVPEAKTNQLRKDSLDRSRPGASGQRPVAGSIFAPATSISAPWNWLLGP